MKMYRVKSESNPDGYYMVRYNPEIDKWHCNCMDFLMREKSKGTCKHIEKSKKHMEEKNEQENSVR